MHEGIDFVADVGTRVVASAGGVVVTNEYHPQYGNLIEIDHGNDFSSRYAHLSSLDVKLGQVVKRGQKIAMSGNTGRSTGPHLHFEMRYLGNALNPASIVNFITGKVHNDIYQITKRKSFYYQHEVRKQASAKYYKVRKGDTLGYIALRNGTSVKAICRLNKIKTNTKLQPGQRIRIK
jgi:murein DD-endopeptidase MepM/ murein hydrolase activator NlpD